MSLRQISLNNFRNIQPVTLDFHSHHNIIYGPNASGKTSLLEAINLLCQGKSFKTHKIDRCINKRQKDFLLFGRFESYKVGFSRADQASVIRLNNENIQRVSLLAKKTPCRVINDQCFHLITGSPGSRREFMDWYLFHVEHNYLKLWSEHKHALKQRNALLKQRKNIEQLEYWDKLMAEYCQKIYDLRLTHVVMLEGIIEKEFADLLFDMSVNLEFTPGWDSSSDLLDQLEEKRSKDIKFGFSSLGSHRDDIKLTADDTAVTQILSRGQIKRLSIALILSQLYLLSQQVTNQTILLIDDLMAELDNHTTDLVLQHLDKINLQVFITNINPDTTLLDHFQEYRLFHVEHGMIKPVRNR